MHAMNPLMQSGYYQSGSIYAQGRSATELTLGAYGLASSLPQLGSSLTSLGDSFGSWGRSTSTTLSGLTQDLSFAYENTALSSETGALQLGNVNLAAPAISEGLSPEIKALSEANITDNGRTVLGSYPGYIEKAQRIGASYFDVGDVWSTLTPAQRTAANQHFLDIVTDAGNHIYLSVPKMSINPESALADEVKYLTGEKRYQWINQWSLKPPSN